MANMFISSKLKELRIQAGLSQKQAYEKLGVSQSTFSSWEIGKSEPDAETFLKLCDLYHVGNILNAFGYENVMSNEKPEIPQLSYEALAIAAAYDKADSGIQFSICKLLDMPTFKRYSEEIAQELAIDKEIEDYRRELEAELKGRTSSASGELKDA